MSRRRHALLLPMKIFPITSGDVDCVPNASNTKHPLKNTSDGNNRFKCCIFIYLCRAGKHPSLAFSFASRISGMSIMRSIEEYAATGSGVSTSALNRKEGARGEETHPCHAYPFAPAPRTRPHSRSRSISARRALPLSAPSRCRSPSPPRGRCLQARSGWAEDRETEAAA
jgi:hypothetical protein